MNIGVSEILNKPEWSWDYKGMFIYPNIPQKKLHSAINSYAHGVSDTEVLILLDDTVFGGAKEGLLITSNAMYAKGLMESPKKSIFGEMSELKPGADSRIMVDGKEFFKGAIIDHLATLTLASRLSSTLNLAAPSQEQSLKTAPQQNSKPNKEIKLKQDSFFFTFKATFIDLLKKHNIKGRELKLHNGLYNNFLSISLEFKNSQYYEEEAVPLIYDDDVIFQSFIFLYFNISQMLSQHLKKEEVQNILYPYNLILMGYADFKALPAKKTLGNAINPLNDLKNANEIKECQQNLQAYNVAYEDIGEKQVFIWLGEFSWINSSEKYDYPSYMNSLHNSSNQEKSYFYEVAVLMRAKTEEILIQYFS